MAEEIKQEEVKVPNKNTDEVLKEINTLLNLNDIADLINSNEKIFEFEGVTYRVRKPNFNQKQEIYNKKMERYIEMLKNDKYLLAKDLVELYKKRGIDLNELDINLKNKIKKRDDFMVKLGGEIKNNANDESLKVLKTEIEELNLAIQVLSIEKTSYLEISIENQLNSYIYSYCIYLVTEKKDGENWVKVWDSYDKFMNDKQELLSKLIYYGTMMIGNDGI